MTFCSESLVSALKTSFSINPYEKELYQNICDIYLKYIAHICKLYLFTMSVYQGCKLLVAHSPMRPNITCGLPEIEN